MDYICATYNQLGFSVQQTQLTKAQEQGNVLTRTLKVAKNGSKIKTTTDFMEAPPITPLAVTYWLERNDAKATAILESNPQEKNLSANLALLKFVVTATHGEFVADGLLGHESQFSEETEA